jgi:hypothetical protein
MPTQSLYNAFHKSYKLFKDGKTYELTSIDVPLSNRVVFQPISMHK